MAVAELVFFKQFNYSAFQVSDDFLEGRFLLFLYNSEIEMPVQTFIPHEIIHLLRFISGSVRTDAEEEAWAVYVQNQVIYELNQSRGLNIPYRLDGSSKLSLPEGEGSGNDSYGELPNNYLYIEMPDADNIDQILKMTIPK